MLDQAQNKWQTILKHYAGVISVAAVGLLLAAIIPVVGVFVCCCRCAGMIFYLSIALAGRNQFHGLKEMETCAVDAIEIKMITQTRMVGKSADSRRKEIRLLAVAAAQLMAP